MFFQEKSICSSNRPYYLIDNRYQFSQTPLLVLEHIQIFQEPLFPHRTDINFPGTSTFSLNRYSFSRKSYLVLGHILFSRRPLCLEQIGIFKEGTPPPPCGYFLNRSRWLGCFRTMTANV